VAPTLPSFEPLATGPKPVTNRTRYKGASDYNNLVGDYTNPILKPWAAEVVKEVRNISLSGSSRSEPANQCWPNQPPFIYKNFGLQDAAETERGLRSFTNRIMNFARSHESEAISKKVTPSFYGTRSAVG